MKAIYDTMAPRYDRLIGVAERVLLGDGRQWACAQATGRVLEVAIATGRNLPFYPEGVQLTGVDLSPRMLDRAGARAETHPSPVDLQLGDAQHLAYSDATFDTVVATLTLCSIPDDGAAVAEMIRVLRPGGRLVLLDHVASPNPVIRAVQRLFDPMLVRLQADHLLREPATAVRRAGLVIEQLERSRWGVVLRLAARKPPESAPPPHQHLPPRHTRRHLGRHPAERAPPMTWTTMPPADDVAAGLELVASTSAPTVARQHLTSSRRQRP